jgi:hypothetical protein
MDSCWACSRGRQRDVVKAVQVDDDVEVAAERAEPVERHQLLRLLVAADSGFDDDELLAGKARFQLVRQLVRHVVGNIVRERSAEDADDHLVRTSMLDGRGVTDAVRRRLLDCRVVHITHIRVHDLLVYAQPCGHVAHPERIVAGVHLTPLCLESAEGEHPSELDRNRREQHQFHGGVHGDDHAQPHHEPSQAAG